MTTVVKIDGDAIDLAEFVRMLKLTGQFEALLEQFVRDRLAALEQECDQQFSAVFRAIRRLMSPPVPPRRRIGFALRAAMPIAIGRGWAGGKPGQ